MDILRKELEFIYASQLLFKEILPAQVLPEVRSLAESYACITDGCAVITDAATDSCYIYSGSFGSLMGYSTISHSVIQTNSSDEDSIYALIHPEDLVDKRLLEYEFFKRIDKKSLYHKKSFIAKCRIRMADKNGSYHFVDNSTQIIQTTPNGKMWLILCTYTLSTDKRPAEGISPCIIDTTTGDIDSLTFTRRRTTILTQREKEILALIREGKRSKEIADILRISIHTVNRHRQNILEKLSVGNSVEAVNAATIMRIL